MTDERGELDNLTRAVRRHTISMKSEADMTAATKSMEGERSGSNRGYGYGEFEGTHTHSRLRSVGSTELPTLMKRHEVRHHRRELAGLSLAGKHDGGYADSGGGILGGSPGTPPRPGWGSPLGRPRAGAPGGAGGAHFGGYLITLPVGTKIPPRPGRGPGGDPPYRPILPPYRIPPKTPSFVLLVIY